MRCLSEASDPADRFLTPLLEPEDLYAQLARQKLHRLVTQKPQNDLTLARHRPSLAKSQRACRQSLAWGKRGRAKTAHAAEQERPDVAAARATWRNEQPGLIAERLVFLDETWARTNMARRYGRAPRGERVVAAIPHGHWKTTTFIAALRHDRITAPCVFDGPINGASFLAWVQQALVPTLSAGDIVIMDNLSSHKVAGYPSTATFFSKLSVMFRSSLDTSIKPILCPRKSGPTHREIAAPKHAPSSTLP